MQQKIKILPEIQAVEIRPAIKQILKAVKIMPPPIRITKRMRVGSKPVLRPIQNLILFQEKRSLRLMIFRRMPLGIFL